MHIHVGNVPHEATEVDLRGIFQAYGRVMAVAPLAGDPTRASGSRFLVDMPEPKQAEAALAAVHLRRFGLRAWTAEAAPAPKETQADFGDFAR